MMEPPLTIVSMQATLIQHDEPEVIGEVDLEIIPPPKYATPAPSMPNCPDPRSYEEMSTAQILSTIIPPLEWIQDGKLWRQSVSVEPATREEVVALATDLESKLKSRNASATGVCAIRRDLFSQVFNELIRQVTVESPETGLMLMRVRDESSMSISASATVYETAKNFQSTCVISSEEPVAMESSEEAEWYREMEGIEGDKGRLNEDMKTIEGKMLLYECKMNGILDAGEALFQKESERLKKINEQLEKQLKLFQGPNPHPDPDVEVVIESILDKFLPPVKKN